MGQQRQKSVPRGRRPIFAFRILESKGVFFHFETSIKSRQHFVPESQPFASIARELIPSLWMQTAGFQIHFQPLIRT
jgi:hypothetical protein